MSFFDKVGEAAKSLAGKTENAIEKGKIDVQISQEKTEIIKLKNQLGELVWAKYAAGMPIDGDVGVICADISERQSKIEQYLKDKDAVDAGEAEEPVEEPEVEIVDDEPSGGENS